MSRAQARRATDLIAARCGFVPDGQTATGHPRYRHPTYPGAITTSGTPSDARAFKNFESDLRRFLRRMGSSWAVGRR